MSITATTTPFSDEPQDSPVKLNQAGYEGTAETLDQKIDETLIESKRLIESFKSTPFLGSITPASIATGTGNAFWLATQAGTYPNHGGFTVAANSFAVFSRNEAGVFSISQTSLDLSTYASKSYVDGLVVGLLDDRGPYNASVNTFPTTGGSGVSGAVMKGDLWYVSVAGTLGGKAVKIGGCFRALVDAPAQVATNWSIFDASLGYIPENTTNKNSNIASNPTSTDQFPTNKGVVDYVAANGGAIKPFVNQAYATVETQVSSLGKIWYNNAATVIGEIPGTSTKWVELLTGYNASQVVSEIGSSSVSGKAVSDYDVDNLKLLKESTLNKYLKADKETTLAKTIGSTASTVIWHEGRSSLNFTAFTTDIVPTIDMVIDKIDVYASHLISYSKIKKNIVVKLYSGVTYNANEPLWNTGTLVFSKSISALEYYVNVLQGTDEANIKTLINADTLKEKTVPFHLGGDFSLTKNVTYTLYFGVDDSEIITSPSTYALENQIGLANVAKTLSNITIANAKYFNKTTKWQSIVNDMPFKFSKTEKVDYYNDLSKEEFYNNNRYVSIKESKNVAKNISRLNNTLDTFKVWNETIGGIGVGGWMAKIDVKKDFVFDGVGFGALKFDSVIPKDIDIVVRAYKNLTFTGNNPDFTSGNYLGESIISYQDYYKQIVKGANAAELEAKYNLDVNKDNEILFEFSNEISLLSTDTLYIIFTGASGSVFTSGIPSVQTLGTYSVADREDLFIKVLTSYYIKQNEATWNTVSAGIPFSLSKKTSIKKYTNAPYVPNNTEIATMGSRQFVNSKLQPFYNKLKTKTTPLNVCLIGSSISALQNFGAELTYDETNLPLNMYNPLAYSSNLWRLLNPGALNQDYSVRSNVGNMEFVKANHATKVVKTGTWESNWNGTVDTKFSNSGGIPAGRHEFFYTKDKGYIEFTIDKDSTGFAIVSDKFSGTRTNGTTALAACNSMKISVDGVEVATVSLVGLYGYENVRFDYNLTPIATNRVIRVENTQVANSWLNIHGVEAWKGKAVRLINNGVSGGSTAGTNNSFNNLVVNTNPDLVVYEHTMINDINAAISISESSTRAVFDKIKALNVPLLVLITHMTSLGSNDPSVVTSWENYPLNTTAKYNLALPNMVKRLCVEYDIPYIDIAQYLYDKDGLDFVPLNYTYDGIHLKQTGHEVYNYMINKVFKL